LSPTFEVKVEYWRSQKVLDDNCVKCRNFPWCFPDQMSFDLEFAAVMCPRKKVKDAMKRVKELWGKYDDSELALTEDVAKIVGIKWPRKRAKLIPHP